MAALELLVSVAVCAALVLPTVPVNVSVAGDRVSGLTAVPVSATTCGVVVAASATLIAPLMVPAAVGLKVTVIAQVFPAAMDFPAQVSVSA